MVRTFLTAVLLLAAAALALPRAALAITLETPLANPDGTSNFNDPKYDRFKDNLSRNRNNNGKDQPRGLTFGPTQNNNPFDNSRFFRLGPPPTGPNQ